ncbi:hypothetical protein [Streptomyces sp. NRRL F-5755]|uniref:hypothetical protein n=1 Tax=Streptomyces sp. NRRL F-5755 TaxID=1519475 RepID=UPI000A477BC1|nr:hypothetical protein [Streptomyces sp. NRRL F-5755]
MNAREVGVTVDQSVAIGVEGVEGSADVGFSIARRCTQTDELVAVKTSFRLV